MTVSVCSEIVVSVKSSDGMIGIVREGFNKETLKVMEFSIQILPPPPRWKQNIYFSQFFLCLYYVYYH